MVSVEPSVEGHPALGYEVTSITVEPATVEVTGPVGALKRLASAVTEPVSIADETRPVREIVTIGVPDASLRLKQPQSAVVTVAIGPSKQP
jgi:YbbR domain-containing protein